LTVRFQARGYEGEEDVPAKHPAAAENARIFGSNEHEKRPFGTEAAAGEGAETPDGKHPVSIVFVPTQ